MKPLSLTFLTLGLAALLAIGGGVYALSGSHSRTFMANQDASSSPASSPDNGSSPEANNSYGGSNAQHGQHGQHMQEMLAQLGLNDAQKQQIDQIRQTVTDRRQRREQIMAILTPDQRTKLEQLRAERRNALGQHPWGGAGGGAPAAAPAANMAPSTP